MSEIVKFLILGGLFAIVAIIVFIILDSNVDKAKEKLLEAYGFQLDGVFWIKPGFSIATETVESMSLGRLMDYLEKQEDRSHD